MLKQRKHSFLIGFLMLVMVLSLGACGKNESSKEAGSDMSGETLTETASAADEEKQMTAAESESSTDTNEAKTEETAEEFSLPDVIELNGKYYSAAIKALSADVEPDNLETLLQFPNLISLDISSYPKDPGTISTLLEKVQELRPEMQVRYSLSLVKAGIEDVVALSDAEELILNDKTVTNAQALKECLDLLPCLKQLELCDCGLTNEEMAGIREEYPLVKVVWMLHMGRHSLRTDAVAFSTLSYDGEPDRLTSEDAEVLRYCTDLMALDLGHQSLTDVSFLDALPELRVLILADNNITDLAPIGRLSELRYLELFINYHITSWDELANLTKLEDLNICFNDWAKDFSFLAGLPNLQRFWAIGCVFTAAQDAQIRSLIPEDCVYRWGGSTESTGAGWRESEKFEAEYEMFRTNTLHPIFE